MQQRRANKEKAQKACNAKRKQRQPYTQERASRRRAMQAAPCHVAHCCPHPPPSSSTGAGCSAQVTSGGPACMLHARRCPLCYCGGVMRACFVAMRAGGVGVPLMNGSAFWATVLRLRQSVHTSGSFRLRPSDLVHSICLSVFLRVRRHGCRGWWKW